VTVKHLTVKSVTGIEETVDSSQKEPANAIRISVSMNDTHKYSTHNSHKHTQLAHTHLAKSYILAEAHRSGRADMIATFSSPGVPCEYVIRMPTGMPSSLACFLNFTSRASAQHLDPRKINF
jgi:hypothetical protein